MVRGCFNFFVLSDGGGEKKVCCCKKIHRLIPHRLVWSQSRLGGFVCVGFVKWAQGEGLTPMCNQPTIIPTQRKTGMQVLTTAVCRVVYTTRFNFT